jgi:uncharacterized phage protein (TIGR02220 family)
MLMAQAFSVQVGNAARKLVLLKLADHANDQGECWPSYQYIAQQCEMNKRSAMRHIEALCVEGFIAKRTRKGPKGNSTNVYVVTLGGGKLSPPSETVTPPSDTMPPPSDTVSPPPSDTVSPRISHSFESASEPVSEPKDSVGQPDIAAAAIDYLNRKAGRNFKAVPTSTKLIRARAKEGATLADFKAVIDRKCAEWLGDQNREQYLRPATLFNAEKFNNYLGQLGAPVPMANSNGQRNGAGNEANWASSRQADNELTRQLTDLDYAREHF